MRVLICFKGLAFGEFAFTNVMDLEFLLMAETGITSPCRAPHRYWLIGPVWYIGTTIQRVSWEALLSKMARGRARLQN